MVIFSSWKFTCLETDTSVNEQVDSLRTIYSGVDEFKSTFAKEFVKCTIKVEWKSANSYPVYSDLPVTQTRFDFP